MIEIRKEEKQDYEEVYKVVKTAFETAQHSDGNEQDLVTELRKSKNFIPELSLVAVKNEKISRDKTAKYHGLEFKNITEWN